MRCTLALLLLLCLACSCEAPAGEPLLTSTVFGAAGSAAPSVVANPETPDQWLERKLRAANPQLAAWLDAAKTLRLQLLVTVVEPGQQRWPSYGFRVGAEYIYPASAIKTLLAVAALRAMNARAGEDIDPAALIRRCRRGRPGCEPPERDEEEKEDDEDDEGDHAEPAREDEPKKHEKLYVGREIGKLLSWSDNDAYNRLWDIVGQREVNAIVAEMGLSSVRFHHRMDRPADRSRQTLRVALLAPGKPAIVVPARTSDLELAPTPAKDLLIGKAYNDGGRRREEPLDFGHKNHISLRDLQRVHLSLLYPERPEAAPLGLSEAQRALLITAMTGRMGTPSHASVHHPLSPGVLEVLPAKQIRYVGKSGRAYGFHLDNAYIEDTNTGRAMFVTATVYANPNGVLNDDDYGYKETSGPLLVALGEALTRTLLVDDAATAEATAEATAPPSGSAAP